MPTPSLIEKASKLSPIASVLLALSIVTTGWIGKTATSSQQLQIDTQAISALQSQVKSLQEQVAQSQVIANELKNVKEQGVETQSSVTRLADELHSWQREERSYHRTK